MLDLAIVHAPGFYDGRPDYGRILEAMLYYDRVHLVMNGSLFAGLFAHLGKDDFQSILDHDSITSTITAEMLGIRNNISNGIVKHQRVMLKSAGSKKSPIALGDDVSSLYDITSNVLGAEGVTRKDVEKLAKKTKRSSYKKIINDVEIVDHIFDAFVSNEKSLKQFLKIHAHLEQKNINMEGLDKANISSIKTENGFLIFSDIEMDKLVQDWNKDNFWSGVLVEMQNYVMDIVISSEYSGDIVSRPDYFNMAKDRMDLSIKRSARSWEQINLFQEVVFEDAHIFSAAVNSGELSIKDALKLIDKTKKFRHWTKGLAPAAGLISEYHKAISKDTPLGKFPYSAVRFLFSNVTGAAASSWNPLAGIAVSAFDSFLIDKIFKGWRPNIFVRDVKKGLKLTE
jgi:hypothetical protein